ncbi:M2 family metallopeptidase [Myxococcota bacterium]|nr:M2 family metallopeptidase [Myxococcota bacterium]MBU1534702.1 M2 family metallopeptidase [Myxococcota bacterium]
MPGEVKKQVRRLEKQHSKLETELNRLWWTIANNTRSPEAQRAAEVELRIKTLYKDQSVIGAVESDLQRMPLPPDRILARQYEVLVKNFIRERYPDDTRGKIVSIAALLEKKFSEYRPSLTIAGTKRKLTLNTIVAALKNEEDQNLRRRYWEAGKKVGRHLHRVRFLRLVELRNEAARRAGFANFHHLSLSLGSLSPDWVDQLFQRLEEVTEAPYWEAKREIDGKLAAHWKIAPDELMPWHYEDLFFQEVPQRVTFPLERLITKNPVVPVSQLYRGLGLELDGVLAQSDLFERRFKNPHAFCIDIDRKGDVRILANVHRSFNWTVTLLHEAGHAAYFKYINKRLPYLLREPAHTFITEGVAMLMQRLAYSPRWLEKAMEIPPEELRELEPELRRIQRMDGLIFARWSLVMYHFEKQLYEDPEADLQQVWWDLKERYQGIRQPPGREDEKDWLTKVHLVSNPVYYHNYTLGLLFSCQVLDSLKRRTPKGQDPFIGDVLGEATKTTRATGRFLRKKIFSQGNKMSWEALVEHATGSPLGVDAFCNWYL